MTNKIAKQGTDSVDYRAHELAPTALGAIAAAAQPVPTFYCPSRPASATLDGGPNKSDVSYSPQYSAIFPPDKR